jgi:oxygen-independent coproporphyrinogen-3 oxidase
MTTRPFSVYVHVPFCAHKCPYCDFNTYAVTKAPEREYVDAVCSEVARYATHASFAGRRVQSVFFGGGTPSFLSGAGIGEIVNTINTHFSIETGAEITLEANPNHAEKQRLQGFLNAGINRVSFGVQSFNQEQLALLGRDHSADEARQAVLSAHDVGLRNISLDIIFGVPGQSMEVLERDLEEALTLPLTHLSTYSLTIEPGTPFFQRQERGLLKLPEDSRVAQMLERIPVVLEARGFRRYEISNYAKAGYESRHNTVYWRGGDYLGVGAGAHSYCAQYDSHGVIQSAERWSNMALPRSYQEGLEKGLAVSWRETLDRAGLIFEFFYLGLRMMQGVTEADFMQRFGEGIPSGHKAVLSELIAEGFIEESSGAFKLSGAGVAVADSVFERLT